MADNNGANYIANGSSGSVILEGQLNLYPKESKVYSVVLRENGLYYTPLGVNDNKKTTTFVQLQDIVGCHCMKSKERENTKTEAYFCVFAYPHKKKLLGSKTNRKRIDMTFTVKQHSTLEENTQEAERWRAAVVKQLWQWNCSSSLGNDQVDNSSLLPCDRKVLVLVNPSSGPGKALEIYQKRVVPILAEADMQLKLVITEYAGHAKELVKQINLSDWYGIVIVSGDGLIYEVINGIMERPDWEQAIKTPIGCVPGGSGNAMCCAINYAAGEPVQENLILHSLFILAKHTVVPMDLVAVDTQQGRLYSFLSVAWGIVSDVDIESEKYRNLGNARFTVGALVRILGLRTYRGRLSFLPVRPYEPRRMNRTYSVAESGPNGTTSPQASAEESVIVTQPGKLRSKSCPEGVMTEEMKLEAGDTDRETPDGATCQDLEDVPPITDQPVFEVGPSGDTSVNTSERDTISRPVETTHLPPLSDPVPSSWTTIEDDFITVVASYQTHLGPDLMAAPDATLNDGYIHLMIVRAGISRAKLVSLFLAMEDGSHLESSSVENIIVRAFRLVPLTPGGVLTVDGEIVQYGPIQAEVLPSFARMMAK